jgi:hypothetical protein
MDAVVVSESTIHDNSAGVRGGGIFNTLAPLFVSNTTVSDNSADASGGGIANDAGGLTIMASTISGNSAALGGGIAHYSDLLQPGALLVTNSTLSGNSAQLGGALFALDSLPVPSAMHHSTVANNTASRAGGGLFVAAGNFLVDQTIVAKNQSGFAPDLSGFLGTGLTVRYSLIGNRSNSGLAEAPIGMPDMNGNLVGGPVNGLIDPKLGPLADNSGPTLTHALLAGSPALDAGDPAATPPMFAPPYDQRGDPFARVFDGAGGGGPRIDIGAFELPPSSPAAFGDYNRNGLVEAADYVLWRKTLGQSVVPYEGADGNGSGMIDESDYTVWRARFGLVPGPLAPQEDSPPPEQPLPVASIAQATVLFDGEFVREPLVGAATVIQSAAASQSSAMRPAHSTRRALVRPPAEFVSRELALIAQQFCRQSENGAASLSAKSDIAARDSVFESWPHEPVSGAVLNDALLSSGLGKDE